MKTDFLKDRRPRTFEPPLNRVSSKIDPCIRKTKEYPGSENFECQVLFFHGREETRNFYVMVSTIVYFQQSIPKCENRMVYCVPDSLEFPFNTDRVDPVNPFQNFSPGSVSTQRIPLSLESSCESVPPSSKVCVPCCTRFSVNLLSPKFEQRVLTDSVYLVQSKTLTLFVSVLTTLTFYEIPSRLDQGRTLSIPVTPGFTT